MADYVNNGGDVIFPALFDADGNVLLVRNGATFTAPDGLIANGIEVVTATPTAKSKTTVAEPASEETSAEATAEASTEEN
jgi:hypothetical protein